MSPSRKGRQRWQSAQAYLLVCLEPQVAKTAAKVALIVGSVLALINHWPALYTLSLTPYAGLQIALTYCVPYAVSSYSSAKALLSTRQAYVV